MFSVQADNKILSDGEYWPYPWGTECPFPWSSISDDVWNFKLNKKDVFMSFYVRELANGDMNLTVFGFDADDKLVLFGDNQFIYDQNVILLFLKDLTRTSEDKQYIVIIRMYDNRLKVERSSPKKLGPGVYSQQYCTETQNREMAVTVTGETNCSSDCGKRKIKHQIAIKIK